jgi:hypothetical protein
MKQADVTATRYGDKRMDLNSSKEMDVRAPSKAARNIHHSLALVSRG